MIKFIGTAQTDNESLLYYYQTEDGHNFFKVVKSNNGLEFSDKCTYVFVLERTQGEEQTFDWKGFRITRIPKQDHHYFLTYKKEADSHIYGAVSNDLIRWQEIDKLQGITDIGVVVPDYQHKNTYVMYSGENTISVSYSSDLEQWQTDKKPVLEPRNHTFDSSKLLIGNAYNRDEHILVIYYAKKDGKYAAGAAFFDRANPSKCIFRSDEPIWEQQADFDETMMPLGSAIIKNELILYWLIGNDSVYAVSCPIPGKHQNLKDKIYSLVVKKFEKNPIISPRPEVAWESRATFNSAAVYEDGKVHFVYRALGDTDLSVLGYATSSDGVTIDHRSDEPIYIPREPFETPGNHRFNSFAAHFASGGGYGGIEDPRLTKVENRFYLTYVAFDGATPPRAAMSSIDVDDFKNKKWDKWASPKLISAPGMVNKSAVIFPKKVNGKYVVLHRVYPNILVDYLDDLEFNDYLQGHHFIPPRKKFWDSKKVGAGAPPMETKDGWLLIYQSVGYQDSSRYKIGAMMLDKNNPSRVLYRTHTPIISPDEHYENAGFKAGVVYPCGSVIMDNTLRVYYGGADTVVCAASADLDRFLYEMKRNQEPKLQKVSSALFN